MALHVGQKVVCVDAGPTFLGDPVNLELGAIYTISRVSEVTPWGIGVDLVEEPAADDDWYDPFYRGDRFRPAVERKTDISALKALLVPGSKVLEDA